MQKKLLLSAICRGVYVYACMHVHLYTYALYFTCAVSVQGIPQSRKITLTLIV